jgi:hypothetical protein
MAGRVAIASQLSNFHAHCARGWALTDEESRNLHNRPNARNRVSCCILNSKETSDSQLVTIISICGVIGWSAATSCCSKKPLDGHRSFSAACSFLQSE